MNILANGFAEEFLADYSVWTNSGDLDMCFDEDFGGEEVIGVTFPAVKLPPNVEIFEAYIQVSSPSSSS